MPDLTVSLSVDTFMAAANQAAMLTALNITLGGAFATSGAFSTTLTVTGNTNITLPTSGTLAILGANSFIAAQTISAGALTTAALSLAQTWNSVGTTCRGFDIAITDTNSSSASTVFRILTGASGTTQVFSVDKDGMPTFRSNVGHFIKMYNSVGAGVGLAGEYQAGGIRCGFGFQCGDGYAPLIHAVSGGTSSLFGAGGNFGVPTSTSPNMMALIVSHTAGTATFAATDKDYSGAYTGAGHSCIFRGGHGSAQSTGGAGGSATLCGGDARGSGNNNGGDVILKGGSPTSSGIIGSIKLGQATSQLIGFWNVSPIIQPTTSISSSTFSANTSLIANDTATWDGYTIGQVVKSLRNIGILA